METKKCSKCKEEKELSKFNFRKDTKDGFSYWCRCCQKIINFERKDKIKSITKNYYNNNIEFIRLKNKDYSKNPINKIRTNIRKKERRDNDPLYHLTHNIRGTINRYFNFLKIDKPFKTSKILGCSFEEFKKHIETQFQDWMNWENYGKYNGELNYGWDIDHIIPISSAKTEEEIIKLNYFSNFQPLCSYTNRYIKKDNI
jgi:hypothetical protein